MLLHVCLTLRVIGAVVCLAGQGRRSQQVRALARRPACMCILLMRWCLMQRRRRQRFQLAARGAVAIGRLARAQHRRQRLARGGAQAGARAQRVIVSHVCANEARSVLIRRVLTNTALHNSSMVLVQPALLAKRLSTAAATASDQLRPHNNHG